MNYEELSEKLKPCECGGKVKLIALGYQWDTFDIYCERCGGRWHMNTYSPIEAAEWWGIEEDKTSIFSNKDMIFEIKPLREIKIGK